jgi:hypothetical protein
MSRRAICWPRSAVRLSTERYWTLEIQGALSRSKLWVGLQFNDELLSEVTKMMKFEVSLFAVMIVLLR